MFDFGIADLVLLGPGAHEVYLVEFRCHCAVIVARGQVIRNCSPYPVCRIGRSSARLAAGCWEVERRRAAEDRYPAARSWGSVTVPGLAIARRVASARYAAGSTPASFADSISV